MGKSTITASLVLYKTSENELKRVLTDIENSSIQKLYVIDNSPSDVLKQYVELYCSKFEYIWGHGNIGYGAAHNIAISKAVRNDIDYHVVINPDVCFDKDVISLLSDYMDKNSSIGQIMPKVIYPNGEIQYLCKLLPTPMNLIGRRFLPFKKYVNKMNYIFEMRKSGYDKIMNVPFLSGCFMFMRVDVLALVGGFSDEYWMYCEDLDLCRKIGQQGYSTVYYPDVSIIHDHRKESYKNKKLLKAHIKSAITYFNKWGWFFDKYRKVTNRNARSQYE